MSCKAITRDQLIDQLSSVVVAPKSLESSNEKTRQLANSFMTCIQNNRNEKFSPERVKNITKQFANWKKAYTSGMAEIATLQPKVEEKAFSTHNITSLPKVWSCSNFFWTSTKHAKDITEKFEVQENLNKIAKVEYEDKTTEITVSDYKLNIKLVASLEQLAKGYAYHTPINKDKISLYSDKTKELETYSVEVIPMSCGINAFGLTPTGSGSDALPILLFRGTSFYPSGDAAGATILTDTNPLGIGYETYKMGQNSIKKWIDKANLETNKKVLITGHSLGNAYATYAGIDNHDKVEAVYGFGATKVSFLYYRKWQRVKENLKIFHINAPGDTLAHFGHVRLATCIIEGTVSAIPKEESIGKMADEEQQKLGFFARRLTAVRPKTTAHRLPMLDKSVTLRKKHKCSDQPNWIAVAFKVVAFVIPYILLRTLFCTKRLILGSYDREGIFLLFMKRKEASPDSFKFATS